MDPRDESTPYSLADQDGVMRICRDGDEYGVATCECVLDEEELHVPEREFHEASDDQIWQGVFDVYLEDCAQRYN